MKSALCNSLLSIGFQNTTERTYIYFETSRKDGEYYQKRLPNTRGFKKLCLNMGSKYKTLLFNIEVSLLLKENILIRYTKKGGGVFNRNKITDL